MIDNEIFFAGDEMNWSTEEIDDVMVATLSFDSLDEECTGVTIQHVSLDRSESDKTLTYVMVESELRSLRDAINEQLARMTK